MVDVLNNTSFFLPGMHSRNQLAGYWIRQAMLRLRREVCWLRHLAGMSSRDTALPPQSDQLSASLRLQTFLEEKEKFFASNETALYLQNKIDIEFSNTGGDGDYGFFHKIVYMLDLDDFDMFVLGFSLLPQMDHAAGPVIGAVLNNASRIYPTPSLIQSLWNNPEDAGRLTDRNYSLYKYGIVQRASNTPNPWDADLIISPILHPLLLKDDSEPHTALSKTGLFWTIEQNDVIDNRDVKKPSNHLFPVIAQAPDKLMIVPLLGKPGTGYEEFLKEHTRRSIIKAPPERLDAVTPAQMVSIIGVCRLFDADLYLEPLAVFTLGRHLQECIGGLLTAAGMPVKIYFSIQNISELKELPAQIITSPVEIPSLTYEERINLWTSLLPRPITPWRKKAVQECSRRFRFETKSVEQIASLIYQFNAPLNRARLFGFCRAQLKVNMGELAQKVEPRFSGEDLILPAKEKKTFEDIIVSMNGLSAVLYDWGMGRPWRNGGLSVLFAGPPGTGKTMASELIAERLNLPMFRIDLSQVVNKYIGETEKNLKKLFDSAEQADVVLFFDEADAIFGKRTEVKDAHDRYANLEVSYLLERMERFKGLAILASNRKSDIDTAFLRRLRYIVHFPAPGEIEREQIWRQVLPKDGIDIGEIDTAFLAKHAALSGGHIRSVVYNASLLCAAQESKKLSMSSVLTALLRTYEKINQPVSPEILNACGEYLIDEENKHEL